MIEGSPRGMREAPQLRRIQKEGEVRGKESIIALVGPIAAGKGTAAALLINQGYVPFNYGDIIYEERTARGLPEVRKNSHAVAVALRAEFGTDIIAKRIGKQIEEFRHQNGGQKILIDGLRHPDEVTWVKENLDAQVVGVNALPEVRYQRLLRRNRAVDPKSPDSFSEIDQEDRGLVPGEHANQTDACLRIADVVIENNGKDVGEYTSRLYEGLARLGIEADRTPAAERFFLKDN